MSVKIDISIGELVDKVTILAIKLDKFTDTGKRRNVEKEYRLLHEVMIQSGISDRHQDFQALEEINRTLWDIEDRIRIKERDQEFDDEFIELARSVYFTNDKRAAVKKRINLAFDSGLVEEKQYVRYTEE